MTKGWNVLLAAATLLASPLACSSRGGLVSGGPTGAAGDPGLAGTGAGGGGLAGVGSVAGAAPPVGLCPSRTGRRPDQLALLGQDGADIVFVYDDGTSRRVRGPGSRNFVVQRNGWVAAYDFSAVTTWKAQLLDVTGRVRAEASGEVPPAPVGNRKNIGRVNLFPDGTAAFDFSNTNDDLVLTPDGRVRARPFFTSEPDAAGWVGANLSSPPAVLGLPVMLNVETGEIRKLSQLAAGDSWAPIVSGARRLYLAEIDGGAVLVDESPDGARRVSLPGFARRDLEVAVTALAEGRRTAYVTLDDGVRGNLPVWLYDLTTGALDSALPDGMLPAKCTSISYPDGRIEVGVGSAPSQGRTLLWTIEPATGALLDYRAGLTVRRLRPAPGGPPQWRALGDGAKQIHRFDRATGALEDLHVAGDLITAGRRALVMRDQRPRAVVSVDDGSVIPIPGGEGLPPGMVQAAGRWAVGYAALPGAPWAPGLPLWRVDLETGETRAFSSPDASLTPLLGGTAPIFTGVATPLLADGRVGVMVHDGLGAGLFLAEPGAPWRAVGRRARQVTWLGWAPGPALAIAAEKDCDCYGPLLLPWPAPPADAPALLSGTSLQFVTPDGTDVFPPSADEHLRAFADGDAACALATTDAHEWLVYDTQARTRRSLGRLEGLAWITDAR